MDTQTKVTITGIIIVVIVVVVWYMRKKESFNEHLEPVEITSVGIEPKPVPFVPKPAPQEGEIVEPAPEKVKSMEAPVEKEKAHEMELKQSEIPIRPAFYDAGSGVLMDGGEFTPKELLSPWYQTYTGNVKQQYILDDGGNGSNGLHYNMCSKACCSEQYPLPFKLPFEERVCLNKQKFVPSPYMCNNAWQDTGCVCMTKGQSDFIGGRGNNA